jgi:BirA family biotin operon repressor/biotin-[acetyl-CoA-carboxylase] ligase
MRLPERVRSELAASSRFGDIRLLEEVDSTNRYVREAARAGAPEGLVVAAEHQTSGRGRLGRRWEAPPGAALLVSLLLRPAGLAPERLHLVTSAVGLAAVEACRRSAAFSPELKWPNDLLVGERKLAGILAERVDDAVVVGIGINVASAPPGAVSVDEVAGHPVGREELLVGVLEGVESRYGRWDEVAAEYARTCATVGRRVRVEGPGDLVAVGTATAVDAEGRLAVLVDGAGTVTVSAADVTHLRPAAGGSW